VAIEQHRRRSRGSGDRTGDDRSGVGQVEPVDGDAGLGEQARGHLEGVEQRLIDPARHRDRRDAHERLEIPSQARHERPHVLHGVDSIHGRVSAHHPGGVVPQG
jgi:hypothetical protein